MERLPGSLEPVILASFLGNSTDRSGRTAFIWAASRGHQSALKIILANYSVQLKDEYQMTPLAVAANEGHEVIVDSLVKDGAGL